MAKAKTKQKAAREASPADLVEAYNAAIRAGRVEYCKADELLEKLREAVGVGKPITLDDGQQYVIEDIFARENKVWKPCGVNRFALVPKR